MTRPVTGSVYATPNRKYGIRWTETVGGVKKRPCKEGFKTKTAAREWFAENVAPRLRRGGPSNEITFDQFWLEYLHRWQADSSARSIQTMKDRIKPARDKFGAWTLRELEGATDDIARWRAALPSEHARYRCTRALRQVLAAAVRWKYIRDNPASDYGDNPEPKSEEIHPFTRDELDRIVGELRPRDAALVIFAAETGLRTNEWIALEQGDISRHDREMIVRTRVTDGKRYVEPKNGRRRRVPLTPRALEALDSIPASIPLVFPAAHGGYINLNNWRNRAWAPALEAAGVEQRGPYALRHTFASEALHRGVSTWDLSRIMGTSLKLIDRTYGHLVAGSMDRIRDILANEG